MATVKLNLGQVKAEAVKACRVGILACAKTVAESARSHMTKGKKIGRKRYAPSRPGQAPSVQTGNLRRSITARNTGDLTAVAGTNVKYGRFLEDGFTMRPRRSRHRTKKIGVRHVAARPWLRPALRREKANLEGVFVTSAKRVMRRFAISALGGAR